MASSSQKDIFSSVISDIKSYNGDDPLRPWVRGIRKIHQSLPPHVQSEKLPRFLQKCAQTFESDRRYRNDSRYLTVWIQLMDYVEDAGVLLRKMEKSQIGVKRAKFFIAYALYYEKKKRFEDAEKVYQLGVQKLAEPMGELQKSYDQFLHRMKRLKHRRARLDAMANIGETTTSDVWNRNQTANVLCAGHSQKTSTFSDLKNCQNAENFFQVDDAYHHGLSDSTINTKEAMNAISSMFKEALQPETISRSLNQVKQRPNQRGNTIEVLFDEELEESGDANHSIISNTQPVSSNKLVNSDSPKKNDSTELQKPFVGAFKILADEDDDEDVDDKAQHAGRTSHNSTETRINSSDVRLKEDTVFRRLKEDTIIRKIVGSTVFDEPKVENACHHGLVDPTVNLKQAIDDINDMFGKPLNFVKARKPKKQDKLSNLKSASSNHEFFILSDDSAEDLNGHAPPCISHSSNGEIGLVEPTLFTKEAMNEINDLFGKSLDF